MYTIEQKYISQIYMDGFDQNTIKVSPNNQRIAYTSKVENRSFEYEGEIHSEKKFYVVINGEETDLFYKIHKDTLTFSPDSTHFAFVAQDKNKLFVVLDNKAGKQYDKIRDFQFSPDSQHLIYAAERDNKWCLVYDEKEIDEYDNISDICYSPDGNHLAISAQKNEESILVIDGLSHDFKGAQTGFLKYSPDSNRLAYVLEQDRDFFVVVDGLKGPACDSILIATLDIHPNTLDVLYKDPFLFSPDSQQIAYNGRIGNYEIAFRNHSIDFRSDGVLSEFVFSNDSQRLMYCIRRGNKQSVVIDGQPCRPYENIVLGKNSVFSPDSAHFAYVAKIADKRCVVIDECEDMKVDAVRVQSVKFAPNSKRILYRARIGRDIHIILDGSIQTEFVNPLDAVFSPKSNHIAYDFQNDFQHKRGLIVDNEVVYSCDGIINLGGGKIIYTSETELQFLAILQGAIYSFFLKL